MVFHVINRANARARIFAKQADYAAFERVMQDLALAASRGDGRCAAVDGLALRSAATMADAS
jgi:hypothetical protein